MNWNYKMKKKKNHKEEVEFLKKTNERYKTELEKLLSGPKKWENERHEMMRY